MPDASEYLSMTKFKSPRMDLDEHPRSVSTSLRFGYLPLYVDYYEGICADFPREKAAITRRCADVLAKHGEIVWDGEMIRDVAGAEAAGKRLAGEGVDCVVVLPTIAVFGGIPWAALRS